MVLLICIGIVMGCAEYTKYSDADYFEDTYLQNVEVISGKIENPSLIIDVDRTEFLEMLDGSSVTTIYRQYNTFYYFNEDATIVYALEIPIRFFWEQRGW